MTLLFPNFTPTLLVFNIKQFFFHFLTSLDLYSYLPRSLFSALSCSVVVPLEHPALSDFIQTHGFNCQIGFPDPFPQLKPFCRAHLFNCFLASLPRQHTRASDSAHPNLNLPAHLLQTCLYFSSHDLYPPSPSSKNTGHASLLPVTLTHSLSYWSPRLPPKYLPYLFLPSHSHFGTLIQGCSLLSQMIPTLSAALRMLFQKVQKLSHYFPAKNHLIIPDRFGLNLKHRKIPNFQDSAYSPSPSSPDCMLRDIPCKTLISRPN